MEFFDELVRYEVALWAAVDHELSRQGGVNLGQLHALRIIGHYDGNARVQDLSGEIGITVGAASKLVDRLERDGLAQRASNPGDRRSSLIALTAVGRQALDSGFAICRQAVERAIAGEDVATVTTTLRRLLSRLGKPSVGMVDSATATQTKHDDVPSQL